MLKRLLLRLADHAGLSALARARTGSKLRILCYHGLWVTPGRPPGRHLWMTPGSFAARMARLRASGATVLTLDDAVRQLGLRRLPEHAVVVTIDDGWWSTWTHMLPVLERHALPATLYATTWYADRGLPVVNVAVRYLCEASGRRDLDPAAISAEIDASAEAGRLEALRSLGRKWGVAEDWRDARQFDLMGRAELSDAAARGLDVQLHTHRHIDVEARIAELPQEIRENRRWLGQAVDPRTLNHFCYPSGTYHPSAPAILAADGIRSATLVDEGLNAVDANPYELRRFLDGHAVSRCEFDAYLSGSLHYLSMYREWIRRVPRALGRGKDPHE